MQLYDRLQICLLAVASRYPNAFVEIDEDVLGFQYLGPACWRPLDLFDLLHDTSPAVLPMMACLTIDAQRCDICISDYSEVTPALRIYCRGKVPSYYGEKSASWETTMKKGAVGSQKPFQHIVVPLDGSTRAEQALPVAAHIARVFGGSLVVMQSVAPFFAATQYATGVMEEARAGARHYLQLITQAHDLAGLTVTSEVFVGPPADMILTAARLNQSDLIVMCSHGETGLTRWMLGSVAQKVMQGSSVPVFILSEDHPPVLPRPSGTEHSMGVMVALDGSPLAERMLVPAVYLSTALSAPDRGALHLVRILPLPAAFDTGKQDSLAYVIQQEKQAAEAYLQRIEQRLRTGEFARFNLRVTTTVDQDVDVASRLLKIAMHKGQAEDGNACAVLALTTHGRSGLKRLIMGSIAQRVLSEARLPVLLLRPTQNQDTSNVTDESQRREQVPEFPA